MLKREYAPGGAPWQAVVQVWIPEEKDGVFTAAVARNAHTIASCSFLCASGRWHAGRHPLMRIVTSGADCSRFPYAAGFFGERVSS